MAGYRPQAEDTTEAVDRMVIEGLRAMSPAERLLRAGEASAALERFTIAGLRQRYPAASDEELRLRAAALRLGRELFQRILGPAAAAYLP